MTHLKNNQMHAMRLDMTLYACGTGRRHLSTKYSSRLRWI